METRLIFVASPGRCGTKYLALMLQSVPGVAAFHEPTPRFSNARGTNKVEFWHQEKFPAIAEKIMGSRRKIYVETAHPWRSFFEPMLELMVPDVIAITREPRDVALSFWRRRSIPGRTTRGKEFLLQPDFPGWEKLTDYQLCYWHAIQANQMALDIAQRVADVGMRSYVTTFEDLLTPGGFAQIIIGMGLPEPNWKAYEKRADWRVNGNPENYYRVFPEGDLAELEQVMLEAFGKVCV